MFRLAITRRPGPNFADGLTTASLGSPDFELAMVQHEAYCEALKSCGVEVITLYADPGYPDCCFVEDTAIITGVVAIITQPGHPSRLGEQEAIAEVLNGYLPVVRITGAGRVDGGDILHANSHYFIGLSERTNTEGARQLASILHAHGFTTSEIPVKRGLHLKSSASFLDNNTVVVTPSFSDHFPSYNVIDTGDEEYASCCLLVNGFVLFPAGYPNTRSKLRQSGYNVLEVEMSEFRKMDGGLTCLSLLIP